MTIPTIPPALNLGCGQFRVEGWVNVDVHEDALHRPDMVGDMRDLPFPGESFERVYAGHVLEHIPEKHVVQALREARRVLVPDGALMIVGPDIDRAREFAPEIMPSILNTEGSWEGNAHKWFPTGPSTLALCLKVFPLAREIPIADVCDPWPVVSPASWQFAVHCPLT